MRPLNRIQPVGPAQAYDTYQIESPEATHYKEVDCEVFECGGFRKGWETRIDETHFRDLADWVRYESGRVFTEEKTPDGMTLFRFPPGQPCFKRPHKQRLDRPEFFFKSHGDHRQRFGAPHQYDRPDQWLDDFGSQQLRLKDLLEKG